MFRTAETLRNDNQIAPCLRSCLLLLLPALLLLLLFAGSARAVPVCDGSTGHCYDTNAGQALANNTWAGAAASAGTASFNGQPGHLVTITSLAESLFISTNLGGSFLGQWIGLRQVAQTVEPGTCAQGPAGGWSWVTAEPFYSGPTSCVFENWAPAEPNNGDPLPFGAEDFAHFFAGADAEGNQWNDANGNTVMGFVIEWEAPLVNGVPEPSTLLLLSAGLVGLGGFAWRRRRGA